MRSTGKCLATALCLTLAATAGLSLAGLPRDHQPSRYAPGSLDQEPVLAVNPVDGSILAAWGYRDGGEYSIAIALKTGESWSEPVFIGRDDRLDQVDPALAFDQYGVAYLAFSVPSLGQVLVTAIAGRPEAALTPQAVSHDGIHSGTPALLVIGVRQAVAFRTGAGVVIRNLPLFSPDESISTNGIQEGPDAVDPLSWVYDGSEQEAFDDNRNDRRESDETTDADWLTPLEQR